MSESASSKTDQEWQNFKASITNWGRERMMALTKQDSFTFQIQILDDNFEPILENGQKQYVQKTYKRRAATNREFLQIQKMIDELDKIEKGDKTGYAEAAANLYQKTAECLLDMPAKEYWGVPFGESKDVLDTLRWEALNGRPLSSKTSSS